PAAIREQARPKATTGLVSARTISSFFGGFYSVSTVRGGRINSPDAGANGMFSPPASKGRRISRARLRRRHADQRLRSRPTAARRSPLRRLYPVVPVPRGKRP